MHIGITVQNIKHPSYEEFGHYLNIRWQEFAKEVGFSLIPITSISTLEKMVSEKYIKGAILSGGGDLSENFPNEIGEKKDLNNVDLEREEIEKKLIQFSLQTQVPLIGICRGMQALGKFFGGKLSKIDNHVNTRHSFEYYCPVIKNKIKRSVNSFHDYCFEINEIPNCFQVNVEYMSSVEQIIHNNERMLGIMWHPEREIKFSQFDIQLFKNFLRL